jgi:hypothetical protein
MIRIAMAVVAALGMNVAQARDNGYFPEAPELPELPAATAKASATCSLWARYDSAYPVAQTLGFLGAFSQCYPAGYETAADAAAAGLPSWRSFGYKADGPSVGPSSPSPGQVYECSVNVNFDPIAPAAVSVIFTGPSTCTAQRDRVLAVVKGSMHCINSPFDGCPWATP